MISDLGSTPHTLDGVVNYLNNLSRESLSDNDPIKTAELFYGASDYASQTLNSQQLSVYQNVVEPMLMTFSYMFEQRYVEVTKINRKGSSLGLQESKNTRTYISELDVILLHLGQRIRYQLDGIYVKQSTV